MRSLKKYLAFSGLMLIAAAANAADAPSAAAPAAAPAATPAVPAAAAPATPLAPNVKPFAYHHVHLYADDPAAMKKWYIDNMGGVDDATIAGVQNVKFGDVLFLATGARAGAPKREGSAGTTVDHIGFSFANLDEQMTKWKAAGIKVLQEPRDMGTFKYGFIEDPWGVKIEVMQDPDLLGFHHVHLYGTDTKAMSEWYQKTFGGEITTFKEIASLPAIKYGKVWAIFSRAATAPAPTTGHSLDHLGWGMPNLAEAAKEMHAAEVKFTMEPRPYADLQVAYIDDPYGTRIELVQPAVPGQAPAPGAAAPRGGGRGMRGGAPRGAAPGASAAPAATAAPAAPAAPAAAALEPTPAP